MNSNASKSVRAIIFVVALVGSLLTAISAPTASNATSISFSSISPTTGSIAGGYRATIYGTGFVSDLLVLFGGQSCNNVVLVSPAEITCVVPGNPEGATTITVTIPYGPSDYGTNAFTYTSSTAAPAPTIDSVSPISGTIAGGTPITVTGTGFVAGVTVTVGGANCTSVAVVSATSITCVTPSGTSGAKDVVVTNADTQTVTATGAFTFTAPVFSGSTPSIPNTYVGSFSAVQTETITNTGNGDLVFGPSAVTVSGTNAADYTIVADNCSSQTVAPAGTCTVTYKFKSLVAGTRTANLVFASNAASGPDTVGLSAVAMGVVTMRKIDDSSGSTRGGTEVEIYGTGFNAAATVTIDGANATVKKRKGSTSITVRTPAHAAGKVLVVVTNPDTGSASYNGFTYKNKRND